jgi:hypothetical protein
LCLLDRAYTLFPAVSFCVRRFDHLALQSSAARQLPESCPTTLKERKGRKKARKTDTLHKMDLHEVQSHLNQWLDEAVVVFQKVPGSAVLIRYVRSSYQNDPVRSAIELVLFIFFIRYLLAPSYSTSKQNYVKLTEDVRFPSFRWGAK